MKLNKEICYALIGTIITIITMQKVSFYENFFIIQDWVYQLILYGLSFLVTLVGVVLAALAILLSFFNKELNKKVRIEEIEQILKSFYFIAKMMGFLIVALIILYFLIISPYKKIDFCFFYILSFFYLFDFYYVVFYIIELVKNINMLFKIKYNYEKAEELEEKNNDTVSIFIQDFILKKMIDKKIITKKNMKKEMYEFVNKNCLNEDKKKKLKNNLDAYFDW